MNKCGIFALVSSGGHNARGGSVCAHLALGTPAGFRKGRILACEDTELRGLWHSDINWNHGASVTRVKEDMVHVHAKDAIIEASGSRPNVFLGMGLCRWREQLQALKEDGLYLP